MSDMAAGLDLRIPIGGLFVALGVVLGGYGLATASDAARYVRSGGVNINLWWGVVMLVTGILFLLGARHGARRDAARRRVVGDEPAPPVGVPEKR